jgi:hypothetical protein
MKVRVDRWLRLYNHCKDLGFEDDKLDFKSKKMILDWRDMYNDK